jgi:calcium-dependent protein kinase
VVDLVDYFEDSTYIYLVMELCAGDMWNLIEERSEVYSEADAAEFIRQILQVVAHCHSLGVIHRDLKPDNFLVAADKKTLKCTDFGLAVFCPRKVYEEKDKQPVGTMEYLPPESFGGVYGVESDIWACGVILYILLSGLFPFADADSIRSKRPLQFDPDTFANISTKGKDLIAKMLDKNYQTRISAQQALDHPWMAV